MKFFCVKTFVALVAMIGYKSEAASLKHGLFGKAIVRRTPTQGCVYTCDDVTTYHPSNHYAFCGDCSKFVQCANGQTFVNNCPPGLLWDDRFQVKTCNYPFAVSCTPTTTAAPPPTTTPDQPTTTPGPTTTTTTLPTPPIGTCVPNCDGIADGDYQSCDGCDVYVSCGGGLFYPDRPCPANLVWDDALKRCEYTSSTCS